MLVTSSHTFTPVPPEATISSSQRTPRQISEHPRGAEQAILTRFCNLQNEPSSPLSDLAALPLIALDHVFLHLNLQDLGRLRQTCHHLHDQVQHWHIRQVLQKTLPKRELELARAHHAFLNQIAPRYLPRPLCDPDSQNLCLETWKRLCHEITRGVGQKHRLIKLSQESIHCPRIKTLNNGNTFLVILQNNVSFLSLRNEDLSYSPCELLHRSILDVCYLKKQQAFLCLSRQRKLEVLEDLHASTPVSEGLDNQLVSRMSPAADDLHVLVTHSQINGPDSLKIWTFTEGQWTILPFTRVQPAGLRSQLLSNPNRVLTSFQGHGLKTIDIQSEKEINLLPDHPDLEFLCLSPTQRLVLLQGEDCHLSLYDLKSQELRELTTEVTSPSSITFVADDKKLLLYDTSSRQLIFLDLENNREINRLKVSNEAAWSVSPDERWVAVARKSRTVLFTVIGFSRPYSKLTVHNLEDFSKHKTLHKVSGQMQQVHWSSDGGQIFLSIETPYMNYYLAKINLFSPALQVPDFTRINFDQMVRQYKIS